ncbi:Leucine rich repeat-containing protein [Xylanibacter ruminicola]|uniref:Leucine rich repeat-containing protein n=1 Tax=Xylanibacter ruminicola TaxID=839 RepID=A0A1H5TYI7_XYLRU|nr:Ig-like domain-containing protein [Xylanibacter ruminicola]SEF67866.1 Leucine rich repeat-containing protein [Xylanibacter ruminicola]
MNLSIKKLSCMALLVAMTMMQTSCDDILGETDNPAPDDDVKTAITLNEATLEMAYGIGKDVTLEATVSSADIEDFDVTWSSSDESVATVDDEGVVHAVGAGTAVITAKAGSKKATCDVSVVVNLETPLTFEAAVDGATVKLKEVFSDVVPNVEYSLDGGITWKDDLTAAGVTLAAAGDKISFRGTNEAYGSEFLHDCRQFFLSAETYVYGNVMSLINKDNYPTNKTLTAGYAFMGLFNGQNMLKNKDADHHIFLPATTLTEDCYYCMFSNCNNLTAAPELPATVMKKECYYGMFTACKNLTTAPELPATTLAENCYDSMFSGCVNLTTAPELPATEMKKNCYDSMFRACINLTTAPEKLPATTLAEGCYWGMFQSCVNLTTAPELPATEMKKKCYFAMFLECESLTTAPELPATMLAEGCYTSMFSLCYSLTTAPELPATTLAVECYSEMFCHCTKLSSVTCKATDLSAKNCLVDWIDDTGTDESVTTKTFYINSAYSDYIAAMNSSLEGTANNAQINTNVPWKKGINGIPAGWTIAAAAAE